MHACTWTCNAGIWLGGCGWKQLQTSFKIDLPSLFHLLSIVRELCHSGTFDMQHNGSEDCSCEPELMQQHMLTDQQRIASSALQSSVWLCGAAAHWDLFKAPCQTWLQQCNTQTAVLPALDNTNTS